MHTHPRPRPPHLPPPSPPVTQGECLRSTRRAEFEAFTATTIGLPNDAFEPRAAANSSGGSDAQIVTPARRISSRSSYAQPTATVSLAKRRSATRG